LIIGFGDQGPPEQILTGEGRFDLQVGSAQDEAPFVLTVSCDWRKCAPQGHHHHYNSNLHNMSINL
jgi:hypothetical protein